MTSSGPTECFVYFTRPDAQAAVIAGRFVLGQTQSGDALGRFAFGIISIAGCTNTTVPIFVPTPLQNRA
jgi:hypothetical protein